MSARIAATVSLWALVCAAPPAHGYMRPQVDLPVLSPSESGAPTTDPSAATAELGAISGTVTDSLGVPIPYANVIVDDVMKGAFTAVDGKYTITGIPAGRHDVRARLLGYATASSAGVRIEGQDTTVVDFKLTSLPGRVRTGPERHRPPTFVASRPDAQLLVGGARFAVDLYTQLAHTPGNLLCSPYSIRTALGMTYAGARGHTEREMAAVLHDALGQPRLHVAASWLDKDLRATSPHASDVELLTANGLWVTRGVRLNRAFTDTLKLRYSAPPHQLDLANGDKARAIINTWVEDQTHARIRDLIPSNVLGPATRLVLCDAIYFRGAWQDSFHYRMTANGPFHLRDRGNVIVPFMHTDQVLRYAENRSLQVLELPYRGDNLAMLIILPREVNGLQAMERQLDPDSLAEWDSRTERAFVRLGLPRFRIEGEFRLAGTLAAMGMRDAFTQGADFSGIARERPLFISEVYHKAFVTVDEHGTEAAAGTAVGMTLGAIRVPERQVIFTADHPFLFLIRHRPSGTILFMGRVADPR